MLLNGNEKKEGKGSLRKRKCWAHRVQTKYSLVHLICTAILCAYICGLLWTHSYYNLQSTWIVKFEQAKSFSFSFPFFFNQRYCNAFRFLFFKRKKKGCCQFFFSISKAFGKQAKKRLVLFYIRQRRPSSTPAPAMFKRQLRGRPDHDHHNALRISALV